MLGGVNRRVIALLFSIVETPDGSNGIRSVRKSSMVPQPYSNNSAFVLSDFIGVTFGRFVWEIRGQFELVHHQCTGIRNLDTL